MRAPVFVALFPRNATEVVLECGAANPDEFDVARGGKDDMRVEVNNRSEAGEGEEDGAGGRRAALEGAG
ncbi:MAG: hypothetical protein ABIU29_11805 [Chthoniobacterales bacterium]